MFRDDLICALKDMIDANNPLAAIFRMVKDRIESHDAEDIKLRLISTRYTDGRTYNLPTASEVAALIVGDIENTIEKRDILIERQCGTLNRIFELHPSYLALQYPLLFPYGEDGFRTGIPHSQVSIDSKTSENPHNKLTMREWLAFRLQDRIATLESQTLLRTGKLFQQFCVDGYTMVESGQLSYIRQNQRQLRSEKYVNLTTAIETGNNDASSSGARSVYTIEFQKRGLPHAHILLFLHRDHKFPEVADVDSIISAEIPSQHENPVLYDAVKEFMMHGPCGSANKNSPCMVGSKCSKHFSKKYTLRTTVDAEGYPLYKRRDNGAFVEKNGVHLDNGYVVPYNPKLLLKYRAHINIERCNQSRSIKYLFKYINKGFDRVTVQSMQRCSSGQNPDKIDEIQQYYDCQYISPCEAVWRIFGFEIHYRTPPVQRLNFHLPGEQSVVYNDDDQLDARELTYSEFPSKFVWIEKTRRWKPRDNGFAIGRVYHSSPGCGERYFMRMLLNIIKGPTCYEDIRTINGITYPSFREAFYALGLLGDDKEYVDAIVEASFWVSGLYLRKLFTTLLLSNSVSRPEEVWNKT
ncbi:hypothetical protein RND81_04G053500 [Saponaria officinalis]|uniref:Helitron helicase-like domain-containing protein n=1 Tax=Saponaria officinalis TaxID=3572 RepID=A0AAW1LI33_SAPOF